VAKPQRNPKVQMHTVFVALILKFHSAILPQKTRHLDRRSEDPKKGVELTQIPLADLLKINLGVDQHLQSHRKTDDCA